VRCSFCGITFKEKDAIASCEGCSMKRGCKNMFRCPNCGYENPGEPTLVNMIRKWRNRNGVK
jgi:hypothetical protein